MTELNMLNETLCSFSEAAKKVPGRPVHLSTLHRWRKIGVNEIRLESIIVGGRRLTSLEAIGRFIEKTTDGGRCRSRNGNENQST